MGKHYSNEFKEKVLNDYKSGELGGYFQVAKKYGLYHGTLWNWIKKDRIPGNQLNDIEHKRGRQRDRSIDYKERYETLKKYQAFIKAQREKK